MPPKILKSIFSRYNAYRELTSTERWQKRSSDTSFRLYLYALGPATKRKETKRNENNYKRVYQPDLDVIS